MAFSYIVGWFNPPLESLSRMRWKSHVRFLGDEGGVIRLSYLTKVITNMKNITNDIMTMDEQIKLIIEKPTLSYPRIY